jgi:hypothetical protein
MTVVATGSVSVEQARRESRHLMASAPPQSHPALLTALLTLHRALSSSTSLQPGLHHVRRLCRRVGRHLEDLTDPMAEATEATTPAVFTARFIEPDLMPFMDALAAFLGPACRPDVGVGGDDAADVKGVADAVIAIVEEDLGPALLATPHGFAFEVPRPQVTRFDPRRHQLLERQAGPKDVVVDVQRFGRVGKGGRLLEPALVCVGDGP